MYEKILLSSAKRRISEPYSKTCSSEWCQCNNDKVVKGPSAPGSSELSVWGQSVRPSCHLRKMAVLFLIVNLLEFHTKIPATPVNSTVQYKGKIRAHLVNMSF